MKDSAASGPMAVYRARLKSGALRPDEHQALAVEMLQLLHGRIARWQPDEGGILEFIGLAKRPEPPKGLYLYGGVGRGKSALMDLFYEGAPVEKKRRVHFHAFMLDVHKAFHELRNKAEAEARPDDLIKELARRVARRSTLLCFDEFDVTDIADAMILGRLFKKLWERGVVVVATSNRPPDDLYKNGLNRPLFLPFIAELKERLDVLAVDGPVDFRLDRLRNEPVYFTPLGPEAAEAMDHAFALITDNASEVALELDAGGRKLGVPRAAKGAARFAFWELCARPLGAADYLALARRFESVFIEDVPRLNPDKRNEAKRFVTLIDVLYEHKVKVVISAEAPPDRLYPEGDGAFEFRRTVSRLIEMQAADYRTALHKTD